MKIKTFVHSLIDHAGEALQSAAEAKHGRSWQLLKSSVGRSASHLSRSFQNRFFCGAWNKVVDSFFRGHLKHLFYSVSHPMGQEFGQEAAGWGFSSHWQQQSSSGGISGWAGRLGSGLVDISHGGSEPEGQCSHKQVVVFPQTRSHKQTSHDATFCLTLLVREVTGPPWFKERDHVLKSRTSPATLNKK